MSANYGFKISRKGVNVKDSLTVNNKRFFQMISTDSSLLEDEKSLTQADGKVFLGYNLVLERYQYVEGEGWKDVPLEEDDVELRPLNYSSWTDTTEKIYVNYKNDFYE